MSGRFVASSIGVVFAAVLWSAKPPASASAAVPESATADDVWTVDMDKSRLAFTASQGGAEFTGAFQSFSAAIRFDPEHPESAWIDVSVDMNSARTGDRQRDLALPDKEWFDAKRYPAARFVSRDVVTTGEDAYEARGALTIRDVSRNVVLPFTLSINGDTAEADGALALDRADYGVGQGGEWQSEKWVGFDVAIEITIYARRAR